MRMHSRTAEQHKPVGRILRQVARPAPKPRKYEMMIVVAPTVTEDGLPAVIERVTGLIETQDGAVESFTHDNPWGHRRLAYPIQNFRDAFYVLYYFDMAPRGVQELDRELRLDEAIIRHLIVKFDPLTVRHLEGESDDDEGADTEDASADTADTGTEPPADSTEETESAEAETGDDTAASDDAGETEASEDGEDDTEDGEEEEE
jgi:small subunit ribosomal protein S6